jgi:hypothetical protein
MGLNVGKMKKYRQEKSNAGRGWTPDEGDTRLYIAPPQDGMSEHEMTDGFNFLDVVVHYGLGPMGKQGAGCLNPAQNPILKHPAMQKALKDAGVDVSGGCPVCEQLDGTSKDDPGLWQTDKDQAMEIRRQSRYIWKIIPVEQRKSSSDDYTPAQPDKLLPYEVGKTVWEGICDVIADNGDITDPTDAKMIKLTRKGTGIQTKYNISLDREYKPTKAQQALIMKGAKWDHESNLFTYVAQNTFVSRADLEALLAGVSTEEAAPESTGDGNPECYGFMFEDGSEECVQCAMADACKVKCEGGEVEPEKPKKQPAKPKREKAKPASDEGDGDGGDPELDELEKELAARQKGE